jgi:hypothetical protein
MSYLAWSEIKFFNGTNHLVVIVRTMVLERLCLMTELADMWAAGVTEFVHEVCL